MTLLRDYEISRFRERLAHEFLLQLFETLAFRLWQSEEEEAEREKADGAVNPEGAAAAQACIERGEGESERAAPHPKGEGAGSHCHSAHTVREYLTEENPCDRTESHGIA